MTAQKPARLAASDFFSVLREAVASVRSGEEKDVRRILDDFLFGEQKLPIGARYGYLATLTRDLSRYRVDFLGKDGWPPALRKRFRDFFWEQDDEYGWRETADGTLYQHMLYERDDPLAPELIEDFSSDPRIDDRLRESLGKPAKQMGPVLYTPLIGRWRRPFMLMTEFAREGFAVEGSQRDAHDVLVARVGYSLVSKGLSVPQDGTLLGEIGRYVRVQWEQKVETHAEVMSHSNRVARITASIAEDPRFGFSDQDVALIALAALAHDLGKAGCSHKMGLYASEDKDAVEALRDLTPYAADACMAIVGLIRARKSKWEKVEKAYGRHPVVAANELIGIGRRVGRGRSPPSWWILPVLCHHKYDYGKDPERDPLKVHIDYKALGRFLRQNLKIKRAGTVGDVINCVFGGKSNERVHQQRAIDIVAVADDIDGAVVPTSWKPVSANSPSAKIDDIVSMRHESLSPRRYRDDVIEALEGLKHPIGDVYTSCASLWNL